MHRRDSGFFLQESAQGADYVAFVSASKGESLGSVTQFILELLGLPEFGSKSPHLCQALSRQVDLSQPLREHRGIPPSPPVGESQLERLAELYERVHKLPIPELCES